MSRVKKLSVIASFAILAALPTRADDTNLVQELTLNLSGLSQGASTTSRNVTTTTADTVQIGTHRVIHALGGVTGNTFSSAAILVVVTPLATGSTQVQVRDGANIVDVSWYFTFETVGGGSIQSSMVNTRTGRSLEKTYALQRIALLDVPGLPAMSINFDVRGLSTESSSNSDPTTSDTTFDLTGTGDVGGVFVLLQGTAKLHEGTLEVDSGSPTL